MFTLDGAVNLLRFSTLCQHGSLNTIALFSILAQGISLIFFCKTGLFETADSVFEGPVRFSTTDFEIQLFIDFISRF